MTFDEKSEETQEKLTEATERFLGRLIRFHPDHFRGVRRQAEIVTIPAAVVPRANNFPRSTVQTVIDEVVAYYEIPSVAFFSRSQEKRHVLPRQVAMYLCRELTHQSNAEIGRRIGGRDQSTIISGVRRIEQMLPRNARLADDIAVLKLRIVDRMRGVAA